jgi:hypothetical protein
LHLVVLLTFAAALAQFGAKVAEEKKKQGADEAKRAADATAGRNRTHCVSG